MSGPSFRIGGIPVRIDLTFFLVVVLLGFGTRSAGLLVAWVVIVTASVLLHELGHAVAFRHYGEQPQILLQGLGGLTSGSGRPLSPGSDLVISLAGPLTGLALLGVPALVVSRAAAGLTPTWQTVLEDMVFVNIAWSVLNLLPVLPLDGGRVTAALWSLVSGREGQRPTHVLSVVVAGVGGLVALTEGYLFGAMFAGFFAAYNVSQLSAERNARLGASLREGWRALGRGDARAAEDVAERTLADRPSAVLIAQAMELQAWSRIAGGRTGDAEHAVAHFPHGRAPSELLLATLDIGAGRSDAGVHRLAAVYRSRDHGPGAPLAAATLARAGLIDALVDRLLAREDPHGFAVADLAVHLHVAGCFPEAAAVGRRALEADGAGADQAQTAYNLACSYARAGEADAALDWVERAVDLGFSDASLLDRDPDLEPIRDHERYRVLRARIRE